MTARADVTATDDEARAAALAFAQSMTTFWQDRLGTRLLGLYLIGSLAHGGFNRRYSDIDMALVAETALENAALAAAREYAAALAPDLAPKLSLFWTDRRFSVGRFPPLDRADYLDHAVVLVEREAVRPARPSLNEVRRYLGGEPLAKWAQAAAHFAALDRLEPKDHKPYLRAQLYPARFAYSWTTGRMASNDEAVAFLHEHRPDGLDVDLLARALECRCAAADPDDLFPARTSLPGQVAACRRLAAAGNPGATTAD